MTPCNGRLGLLARSVSHFNLSIYNQNTVSGVCIQSYIGKGAHAPVADGPLLELPQCVYNSCILILITRESSVYRMGAIEMEASLERQARARGNATNTCDAFSYVNLQRHERYRIPSRIDCTQESYHARRRKERVIQSNRRAHKKRKQHQSPPSGTAII